MKNWQKVRNYRKHKNADGTVNYVITADGADVDVSADEYIDYSRIGRKMEYMECDLKRNRSAQDEKGRAVVDGNGLSVELPEREVSLEKLISEGWDFPSSEPPPEDAVIKKLEIEALHNCIDTLNADERALIDALFFDGLTERGYSQKTGIAQKTINDRKHKVLKKLKKLLKKS